MPRLPPIQPDGQPRSVRHVFDRLLSQGRQPSPLYRTLAHAPKMLAAWVGIAWPLRADPTMSRALRELVILRIAQLTRTQYAWKYHWPQALAAGVAEAKLRHLDGWRASSLFSREERVVLDYAEAVSARSVTDGLYAEVAELFPPKAIVELTLTASFYSGATCLLQALQIEPDPAVQAAAPDGWTP